MGRFIDELKRRNVVRVAVAYIVIGWLAFQLGEIVLPTFEAPGWVFKTLIFFIVLGFPFVLLFAWAFEVTPDGVKKTRDVNITQSVAATTGRKIDFIIIGALVVALGYFIWDRGESDTAAHPIPDTVAESPEAETQQEVTEEVSRSIAVLPFDDLSPEGDQEWFADGLAEEILNSLAKTPDLLVASRTSSFAYKGSSEDIQSIANAMGVDHVLEGSVRRSESRLRVTAQLIRASDGFHLWSETFDRTPDDMIEIQENVAIEIANALQTAMDPAALAQMVSAGTSSIPAFEAYLEGLAFGVSDTSSGDIYKFAGARDAYERAIALDTEFANAYWQLAQFWSVQMGTANITFGVMEMSMDDMRTEFDAALENAIKFERDADTRIKYQVLESWMQSRWSRAWRLNSTYLQERPFDLEAQNQQMQLLLLLSRYDELKELIDNIVHADLHEGFLLSNAVWNSQHINDREYIHSVALFALETLPGDVYTTYQVHRALLFVGDVDRASRIRRLIVDSDFPDSVRLLANLRQACTENRLTDAQSLFDLIDDEHSDDLFMVWIGHQLRGDTGKAVDVLRHLDDARDFKVLGDYMNYPQFDPAPFPNLMAHLESEGAMPKTVTEIPYRCNFAR